MQLETHAKPSALWVNIGNPAALSKKGRALVKIEGKAIAVFDSNGKLYACNNRCPHEGYPLMEGVLTNHPPRKPSSEWTRGRSCTNNLTGPLSGG